MEPLRISTDIHDQDVALIHRFLSQETAWARQIPFETVRASVENSLNFGGFVGTAQVAYARVISDYATFAYLVDVFVLPQHRGKGYSAALMAAVMSHPRLQGLRRFMLATSTAHGLYEKFGFASPAKPQTLMERYVPDLYSSAA
ncbi:GNAT family N-acetyltransferase [Variovorax sp. EL159]|uniref:GNAT family N-acetyltransferase n=1 Tax=unclassified Variovorax TaxID=663243 RepID=UPI0008891A93|nr:GNAT family N-acetyltransferase [Variovorax sp. EL159]SCX46116.1 Acetyltransferase (GNAT) family protein [Variovorax sp. EL159]